MPWPRCPSFLLLAWLATSPHRHAVASVASDACAGIAVYVYRDLPSPFPNASGVEMLDVPVAEGRTRFPSVEFGVPCDYDSSHACSDVQYWGRGARVPEERIPAALRGSGLAFHRTLQNALPWMVAGHLLAYCAVNEPKDADLFFVPYPVVSLYRASQKHHIDRIAKDEHSAAVAEYLAAQPAWRRCNGCDHFFSVEAPISKFRSRRAAMHGGYYHGDCFWVDAARLSHHAFDVRGGEAGILVPPERPRSLGGYLLHTIAMPWPLNFQPDSDAQLEKWFAYAFGRDPPRDPGAVLMVAPRRHREVVIKLCAKEETPCTSRSPRGVAVYAEIYRNYTYSIQPGGDTPTRRGFFDSLLAGCIPVVFVPTVKVAGGIVSVGRHEDPNIHYRRLYSRFLGDLDGWGDGWLDRVALVGADEADAMRLIRETPPAQVDAMRANIRRIIPRLLFWDHTAPPAVAAKKSRYRGMGMVPRLLELLGEDLKSGNFSVAALHREGQDPSELCVPKGGAAPLVVRGKPFLKGGTKIHRQKKQRHEG